MASGLPVLSGRDVVRKLRRAGWTLDRRRGSHMMLTHPDYRWTLSVPDHKEIGRGLLRGLLKQAGLSAEEFLKL